MLWNQSKVDLMDGWIDVWNQSRVDWMDGWMDRSCGISGGLIVWMYAGCRNFN